jgi:hypothetical protein
MSHHWRQLQQQQQQQPYSDFPAHQQGKATLVTHVPVPPDAFAAGGKRQRDSPEHDNGSWQSSFKRLKVMDEGETSFAPSSSKTTFPLVPSHHPPQLSHEVYHPHQQQQQKDYPNYYHKGDHHRYQQQQHHQQQQCTGQRSSEVPSPAPVAAEYQSMNHFLGDLHAMRHRQRAGDTLTAHHQQMPQQTLGPPPQMQQQQHQHQQPTLSQYPIRPSKKVSLRVNSKLY